MVKESVDEKGKFREEMDNLVSNTATYGKLGINL
jgi:hypothetical protein